MNHTVDKTNRHRSYRMRSHNNITASEKASSTSGISQATEMKQTTLRMLKFQRPRNSFSVSVIKRKQKRNPRLESSFSFTFKDRREENLCNRIGRLKIEVKSFCGSSLKHEECCCCWIIFGASLVYLNLNHRKVRRENLFDEYFKNRSPISTLEIHYRAHVST